MSGGVRSDRGRVYLRRPERDDTLFASWGAPGSWLTVLYGDGRFVSAACSDAPAPGSPSIALVVLNWNGVADTLECLASLRESLVPVRAIVVDNGSTGSDVAQIRDSGLADVLIEAGTNRGFAEGNNLGLRHALESAPKVDVIGVLNNDTVVDRHCVGDLVNHLTEVEGEQRAVAPTMSYADDPTQLWFGGGIVENGWPRHLQPEELGGDETPLRRSEWLTGCCILARAETWQRVGLFDPKYYLLFEDCDWSLRARRLDVALFVAPRSRIQHRVSRSSSTGPASHLRGFYFVRNGLRFTFTYERRHLAHFLWQWLLAPTLRQLRDRHRNRELDFRWLGALAFACRQTGRAPAVVMRLAKRRARR